MKKIKKISVVTTLVISLMFAASPTATFAAGPAPVDLLSVSTNDFAVLSKSGITNTGSHTTDITGNIGSSPITAAAMDNVFCSEITGTIYGVDAAYTGSGDTTCFQGDSAAKTLVDNAVLDMETAYNDAAGRTNPTATELGAGDIGGMTIAPGLYKWSTDVTIPTDVTLEGGADDVWIFQIAGDLDIASGGDIASGIKVVLSGGAQASNIFWQVGGVTGATLGTYSTFNGTILSAKQVIIETGAVLNGRALAQTQVTLDANTILVPEGVTPPPDPEPTPEQTSSGGGFWAPLPHINVTKIPSPLSLPAGPGSVTYTYTATNEGEVAMRGVWVEDNKCSPVEFISGDTNGDELLDIDESWTYSCTKTVSETETNTATAHGQANGWDVYDTANATVVVGLSTTPPLIHVVKKPNVFILPVGGGAVTYTYTVTNPGTEPLNNVSITDNECTGLPGRVVGHSGDLNNNDLLESNETWSFTCQTNLTQTTTNIGTAQGSANGLTATDFSAATVSVTPPGLPDTGVAPGEKTPWAIATMFGILAPLAFFYISRRKQTT